MRGLRLHRSSLNSREFFTKLLHRLNIQQLSVTRLRHLHRLHVRYQVRCKEVVVPHDLQDQLLLCKTHY